MISENQLDVLLDFSNLVQASLELDQFSRPLLDLLKRLIPYESATLYLPDASTGELVCESFVGDRPINLIDLVHFDHGSGLSGWIAKQGRPILIPVLRRGDPEDRRLIRSFIGLPLTADERLVGVINFGHSHPGAFEDVEESPLRILGAQIALVLRNLLLVRDLKTSNRQLGESNRRLKAMQQSLVADERLKAISEVVTTMNHEINNPLTIISGNAELLSHRLRGMGPDVQERLGNILSQSRRLGRVMSVLANLRNPVSQDYLPGERMINLQASLAAGFAARAER